MLVVLYIIAHAFWIHPVVTESLISDKLGTVILLEEYCNADWHSHLLDAANQTDINSGTMGVHDAITCKQAQPIWNVLTKNCITSLHAMG